MLGLLMMPLITQSLFAIELGNITIYNVNKDLSDTRIDHHLEASIVLMEDSKGLYRKCDFQEGKLVIKTLTDHFASVVETKNVNLMQGNLNFVYRVNQMALDFPQYTYKSHDNSRVSLSLDQVFKDSKAQEKRSFDNIKMLVSSMKFACDPGSYSKDTDFVSK